MGLTSTSTWSFRSIALCGALLLAGCSQTGPKQETGTVLGAVAGGLIGSQFGSGGGRIVAAIAGAAIGGFVGGAIGAQLDEEDRMALAEITEESFETGRPRVYHSRKTGVRAKVRIIKTEKREQQVCRTASQEVVLKDGTQKVENVTACKSAGGGWVV